MRWIKRQTLVSGQRAGYAELVTQVIVMRVLVPAADSAPGKIVDQVQARSVTLPRQSMTIAELEGPKKYELPRPFRYWISTPEDMASRVVQFLSRELKIGELIPAIEAQTKLRHRFAHCGNGFTILWCGDCSFGLLFRVMPQTQ